jgi:uncharacterized protein YdeI (YjbR/CyaY-like superfamily)
VFAIVDPPVTSGLKDCTSDARSSRSAVVARGEKREPYRTAVLNELPFAHASVWRSWLEINHQTSSGVWMMVAKKGSGVESVTYDEAVDEALCFGWIDGQRKRGSDTYFLQRFTPRTKRSPWSRINTERVARLTKAKKMRAAGLREVEAAKADGRWGAAYAGPATAAVPEDLEAALRGSPAAAELFARLDSRNRYAILYRLGSAKLTETRARRIATFVADLERGVTPYPRKQQRES